MSVPREWRFPGKLLPRSDFFNSLLRPEFLVEAVAMVVVRVMANLKMCADMDVEKSRSAQFDPPNEHHFKEDEKNELRSLW